MPRAQPPRTSLVLYGVLALLFAVSMTYRFRDTTDRIDELLRGNEIARIPFDPDLPEGTLGEVQPEAAAAGIVEGDRLVAIGGARVRTAVDVFHPVRVTPADRILEIEIEPASAPGQTRTAAITLRPMRETVAPSAYDVASFVVVGVALPYLCLALGYWVVAVRVRDSMAWLLLLVLLSLAEFASGSWRTVWGRDDWFQPLSVIYQPLLSILWTTSMMLFGIYFPERLPFDRRHPWAKWLVIGPLLVSAAAAIAMILIANRNMEAAMTLDRLLTPFETVAGTLQFVAIGAFFAALGFKALRERRPDARRRLRLLWAGAAIALAPLCIFFFFLYTGSVEFAEWMILPVVTVLFVFPATMAYVIVVQRAMDVRLVIRQGVQYLLARGTVRAIQLAISTAIVVAIAMRLGPFAAPEPGIQMLVIGGSLVVIVLIRRAAEVVRRWLDRRFFREAYNAEQILGELANKVRTIVETRPLLETVAHQIADALHVPRVAILLTGGGALQPAYALGYDTVPAVPVRAERPLTDDEHRELRETLDAELVLPLSANQTLIGVMGLGPKQSEEPFTAADIRLLDAVAVQTGLALANSRLVAEIATEVAAREKAHREIEIAREVQERLFPQDRPPIHGLEYDGACRPALGVGGDYYDFIPVSANELGIAIGDVSGKGIPAALLMATLRAYLRGQTIHGESDLAALMANLNRLVYESSAANRYATFFYGQYDAATHVLKYVNAGHNPPMLFKRPGYVIRLDVGGAVVGLIEGCAYQQGCVTLDAGDVLVAFTDGVSEAMNRDMDEWGEDRLMAAVVPNRGLASSDLITRLMREADAFAADAPQHDDMTVVILRRVE
jgi:sigma-B regulation protein RsbU (phosphoserine phosphatase)